ncbi:MAG: acyl-CoA dehydrogenase family protein [Chloroflexi bacterium]|nr:acyl-CoA dehydrogenase family protein [Chloroflexota bacterium]
MDFGFTASEIRLKQEIADFARREMPADVREGSPDFERQFHGRLWETAREIMPKAGARGWLGPAWPVRYGGRGASPIEQVICFEEMAYWGIPGYDMGVGGISWIGPSLLAHGSETQKLEHLPPLAQGRRFWCTAYSEPGAGSDMASLQSTAVRRNGEYAVNGQKVWTSASPVADWCWLLLRTGSASSKHRGLSLFVLDMRTRGLTVRPLAAMTGTTPFGELFFDDVRVPLENLVGEEGMGWDYVVAALEYERASVGVVYSGMVRRITDELIAVQRNVPLAGAGQRAGIARHKLAELAVESEICRLLAYRAAVPLWGGQPVNVESAQAKVFSTELSQRAAQLAMELAGLYGQLSDTERATSMARRARAFYLSSTGNTILAGTSEIERNVIAQRGLGLPR